MIHTLGTKPNQHVDKIYGAKSLGGYGKLAEQSLEFGKSGNPRSSDRFGWPIDKIQDSLIFDWSNDDGLNPFIGPALTLDGTVTVDQKTPITRLDGLDQKGTCFDNSGLYKATSGLPTINATDDFYLAMLLVIGPDDLVSGTSRNLFCMGNNGASNYWYLRYINAQLNLRLQGTTLVNNYIGATIMSNSTFCFLQVSIDKDGQAYYFLNSYYKNFACPSGAIYDGNGWSISGYPDLLNDLNNSNIARVMLCAGPNIADTCQADSRQFMVDMFNDVMGLNSVLGSSVSFDRDNIGSYEEKSTLWFCGYDCPVVKKSGINIQPYIVQKCYKNYNQDTGSTGLALSAGSFTWPDESSSLSAATVDVSILGPKVAQFANSSGVDQYITSGTTTGNTNKHSVSGYARITVGSGARIGLLHTGGTVFQDLGAVGSTWDRLKIDGATPAANDAVWCIMVPNGCTVQVTGQQLEQFNYVTNFLPNNLTAATVVRSTDRLTLNFIPDNDKNGFEFDFKSRYSGVAPSVDFVVWDAVLAYHTQIPTGLSILRAYDGTNILSHTVNVLDNNWHHIIFKWDSSLSKMFMDVDGVLVEATYDGVWSSNTLVIGGTYASFYEVKNYRLLRG